MTIPKLDHIVIKLPESQTPADLLLHAEPFKKNFTLLPGGLHTGGMTQNLLVSFADGFYLELIAFTSTPPKEHPWSHRKPTKLIDFAFLGHPEQAKEAYQNGRPGGRGECKWVVTMPKDEWGVGNIPFWCGDITPRELRVPKPTEQPSGVAGVSKITILVESTGQQERVTKMYQEIIGDVEIKVGTPSGKDVTIDIRVAETKEEKEAIAHDGQGIYKVEFNVPGVVLSNNLF